MLVIDFESQKTVHERNRSFGASLTQASSVCLLALIVFGFTGCQQIKEQFNRVRPNNPVVGPPPPRISLEDASVDTLGYAQVSKDAPVGNGLLPVSYDGTGKLKELSDTDIVATINGSPILAGDIFSPYTKQLGMMKKQIPPGQFPLAQRELLKRDLPDTMRRKLLAHALKASLKQEQVDQLDTILDEAFAEHVANLLEKTQTASAQELEKKLNADGTSLEELRKTFGDQQLAMQYLGTKSEVHLQLGRLDLLQFYNENIEKYTRPEQIQWQEIRISFHKNGGRAGALEKLNQVGNELQQGHPFEDVARKFSDGATAENGGEWDWTQKGSLADTKIDQLLFSMKKGYVSSVLESPNYFQIVRVADRRESYVVPFEDVQQKIRAGLTAKMRREKTIEVIKELKASADIETIFDHDPETKAKMREFENFK